MMRGLIRKIFFPLPFVVRWYLSKERTYRYKDIQVTVLPGVFHPGFFFSTSILLEFLEKQFLKKASVLELGAGTGIISVLASRMGANVVATDISSKAVKNIAINARKNDVLLTIISSDLFTDIPVQKFDWIIVNPPYYPHAPANEDAFAWHCGEHHEYFQEFFSAVGEYMSSATQLVMVLSDVCDLDKIKHLASSNGFELVTLVEKNVWIDGKNYIFKITPV